MKVLVDWHSCLVSLSAEITGSPQPCLECLLKFRLSEFNSGVGRSRRRVSDSELPSPNGAAGRAFRYLAQMEAISLRGGFNL